MESKIITGRAGEVLEAIEARTGNTELAAALAKAAEKILNVHNNILADPLFQLLVRLDPSSAVKLLKEFHINWVRGCYSEYIERGHSMDARKWENELLPLLRVVFNDNPLKGFPNE